MTEVLDSLFDNVRDFAKYVHINDSAKLRKRLLITDKLRLWYCRYVCCRESIYLSVAPDSEWGDSLYAVTVGRWLWEYKGGKSWEAISKGYGDISLGLPAAPREIMSLEDEAKEVEGDG